MASQGAAPAGGHGPPATAAAARQRPGAGEFFEKRLARAAAIPAEQRSPEVAAFVESVQLSREACELLPLTAGGEAVLPPGPRSRRQLLLALAKLARCSYVCPPVELASDRDWPSHLVPYLKREMLADPAFVGSPPGGGHVSSERHAAVLASAMLMRFGAGLINTNRPEKAIPMLVNAVRQACQPSTRHGFAQLAASEAPAWLLLSVEQLTHACCCLAVHATLPLQAFQAAQQSSGSGMLSSLQRSFDAATAGVAWPPAEDVVRLMEGAALCVGPALGLEPDSPKTLFAAGSMAHRAGQAEAAVDHYLRAARLARQQGSDWWAAHAAAHALARAVWIGISSASEADASRLAVVIRAYEQAPAAAQRCRRVLPHVWVDDLDRYLAICAPQLSSAQARLHHIQAQRSSESSSGAGRTAGAAGQAGDLDELAMLRAVAAALAGTSQTVEHDAEELSRGPINTCAGCGRMAAALRRCGRCKQAQYCSRECQAAHWKAQHRRECKEA